MDTAEATSRRYLDILTSAFMVRQLPPWFENIGKRQVKAPKVFVRDSGLLHALLGLDSMADLAGHHKLGASWEGFALEQVLRLAGAREAYFWATHAGAELDLMLTCRGKRVGFEFKYADAPTSTKSMHIAMQDLRLERLLVIYPGTEKYSLTDRIEAIPLRQLSMRLAALPE